MTSRNSAQLTSFYNYKTCGECVHCTPNYTLSLLYLCAQNCTANTKHYTWRHDNHNYYKLKKRTEYSKRKEKYQKYE